MSLRSEAVRLALRWLIKRQGGRPSIKDVRVSMAALAAKVPRPPAGTEVTALNGIPGDHIATPNSLPDRHVLYLHGGGYVAGSPALYRQFTHRVATATRARVRCIDYRLAPENPFPAALNDAVAAYRQLLADGAHPRRIAIIGDSAGGGLTLATTMKLRDDGLPLPAAAVALSPWTDLALTGASMHSNARSDPMLSPAETMRCSTCYLGDADPRTPYASPLYGDPQGLPPTLIHVGSDEMLHDDSVRMAERMRAVNCRVELEVWQRMPHVWHVFAPFVPESQRAIARIGAFVDRWMD
jgi:epsilon-lactone hydrolase